MSKFTDKIMERFPFIGETIEKAKDVSLPGLDEVPVYDVVVFFIKEIKKDVITVRAQSIAFSFFLALFPSIIFIFTLIPYIPIDNIQENLISILSEVMPENAFQFVDQTITDLVKNERGGLLSLGFFLALFFSSNGVLGIMSSFNKSLATFEQRNPLVQRWVAIKLTVLLFVLLISSITLIVGGNFLLTWLLELFHRLNKFNFILFSALKYMVIMFLFFMTISTIYYYAPATTKKWKFMSTGSTIAALLMILTSVIFSYFVNNFGSYNRIYGSLGTIMALQIWIYLNSFILLIGFELNASIDYNKRLLNEEIKLPGDNVD